MTDDNSITERVVADSELILDRARTMASEFLFEHLVDEKKNYTAILNNMEVLEFVKIRGNWQITFKNYKYPDCMVVVHHDIRMRMTYLDLFQKKTCASVLDHPVLFQI